MVKPARRELPVHRGLAMSPLTGLNRWCRRRRRGILAALVLSASLLRVGYFVEMNTGPLVWQHKWNQSDMNYFDRWAGAIAEGDWLSRHVDPPQTSWMTALADEYFEEHSSEVPERKAGESDEQLHARGDLELWQQWAGPGQYFQEPLYPYLVAVTYKLIGADVRFVFVWQLLLGIGLILCIHIVTRQVFGDFAALIAGAMAVSFAPLLLYEMILLRDGLVALTSVLLAALGVWAMRRGTKSNSSHWLVYGIACGAALLLKSHFVIVAGLVLAWLAGRGVWRRSAWIRPALLFSAGIAIAVTPLVARNVAVGAAPFVTAGGATATMIVANSEGAGIVSLGLSHFVDIQSRAKGNSFEALTESIATHSDISGWVALLAQRFAAVWHWYEWPSNENFYYYRLHSRVLSAMPLTFFVLGPLGLVGALLGFLRLRRTLPLYWVLSANLAVLVLFFVQGRYRVAFAATLLPFAGMVVAYVIAAAAGGKYRRAGILLIAIATAMTWTSQTLPSDMELIRPADFQAPYGYYYLPRIAKATEDGDFKRARQIYVEALDDQPSFVRTLRAGNYARSMDQEIITDFYSQMYGKYAEALAAAGDFQDEAVAKARAKELYACARPPGSSLPRGL